jgi:membrane-associated phospholipid phosphatase
MDRSERSGAPRWLVVLAIIGAVLTEVAILVVDRPFARELATYEPLALWDRGVDVLEWAMLFPLWRFALPIALVAGMLVAAIVPRWRIHAPAWMFVAGVHLISRLTVNWIKDATGRLRPTQWLSTGSEDTFAWEKGISFPSGHVTLFTSIALPIAVLYPRSRPVVALAIAVILFISAARVGVNAHFVSDALGAFTLVALWTLVFAVVVRPRRTSP